jgi:hypothetical protein
MGNCFAVEINPVVNLGAWDDQGVALADGGDGQERHTEIIAIDEATREFPIDDF